MDAVTSNIVWVFQNLPYSPTRGRVPTSLSLKKESSAFGYLN